MAASYVERLLWKYFKDNVFGGFSSFIDRSALPWTLLISSMLACEYLYKIRPGSTVLVALSLMLIGIILWKRPMNFRAAIISAILLSALWAYPAKFGSGLIDFLNNISMLYGTLFAWYLFNASMFIIQTANFFASTAGMVILYGSDKERIFLSPLEQLISASVLGLAVWKLETRLLDLIIVSAPILITLLFAHVIMRGKGRILKSAYGLFTFVVVPSTIGFVMGLGRTVNATIWFIIAVFSLLFAIQNYTRTLVREKRVGIKFGFLAFLGLILLILHLIITPEYSLAISIRDVWLLSILAAALAPIVSAIYFYATGKIEYYVRRNMFTWKTIVREISTVLGMKALEGIRGIIWGEVMKLFGGRK
ncbi:MAG: hypothetical protein QXE21_05410 [Candidatus Korarchaeota archaeon]|nr:hypothetical protein [Thermoproteota archaeon]